MHATCFEWYLANWQKQCPLVLATYPALSAILCIHADEELRATRLHCLLYCKNLNDTTKRRRGVEKASPCTEPLSTVISVFPFCSLMQKKEIRPPFYGFSFGVPVCVRVCAPPKFELANSVRGRIKSNKIANTYNDFFSLLSSTQRVAICALSQRQVRYHFILLLQYNDNC